MSRHKKHQTKNPFLAQMLIRYAGKMAPCQGVIHQQQEKPAQAEWEVRMYQNFDMTLQLMEQGTPRDQINQVIWDAACKEQDTVGIVNHKTMYLCSECAHHIASNHAGDAQTTLTMTTAMVTGGAFLLVSDRLTEAAAIVGNIPGNIEEQALLEKLQRENMIDIRFKDS